MRRYAALSVILLLSLTVLPAAQKKTARPTVRKSAPAAAKKTVAKKTTAKKTTTVRKAAAPKKTAASRKTAAARKTTRKTATRASNQSWRRGQMQPTPERYREIQQALIDKGYYDGEPTGVWGSDCTEALKKFQQDQSLRADGKLDSLTLISLGLGPRREPLGSVSSLTSPPGAEAREHQ